MWRCRADRRLPGENSEGLPSGALRPVEFLTDPFKGITFRNSAAVTLVNRGAKRRKFGLVQAFLHVQGAQPRPYNFARVLVLAALDFGDHKAVKFIREVYISGRHGPILGGLAKIAKSPART